MTSAATFAIATAFFEPKHQNKWALCLNLSIYVVRMKQICFNSSKAKRNHQMSLISDCSKKLINLYNTIVENMLLLLMYRKPVLFLYVDIIRFLQWINQGITDHYSPQSVYELDNSLSFTLYIGKSGQINFFCQNHSNYTSIDS